jgi:hypothetical protein
MKTITHALLLCTGLLLFTACPGTRPVVPPPPPPLTFKIGLAAGATNSYTCTDSAGNTQTGRATAIALALRDTGGNVIGPNSGKAIALTLSTPSGKRYLFKNPYNPLLDTGDVLPASENYFVLCTPPENGDYTIVGTIAGDQVSDFTNVSPQSPSNTPGSIAITQQAASANVDYSTAADDQIAIVNYYRGDVRGGGYRVGTAAETVQPEVVVRQPPEERSETLTPREQERSQEDNGCPIPDVNVPQCGGRRIIFPQATTSPASSHTSRSLGLSFMPVSQMNGQANGQINKQSLKPQALRGNVNVALPAGHADGESYFAEILTSNLILGSNVSPESLQNVSIQVRYSAPTKASSERKAVARASVAPMRVKINSEVKYTAFTLSVLAHDGFPSFRDWQVFIEGPNGQKVGKPTGYRYPRNAPYLLVAIVGELQAGNYQITFQSPGSSVVVNETLVNSNLINLANDVSLNLKSDRSGFTLSATNEAAIKSHWVYVYKDNDLVALKTCAPVNTTCDIPKLASITLSNSDNYTFNLVSTDAPLDRYPLLNTANGWAFNETIRWSAILLKSAASNLGYVLTVSKTGTGSGKVTSNPAGIDCGTSCSASYDKNDIVVLTASPTSGSSFAGWSGVCSGTATCSVTMDASKSVTANFKKLFECVQDASLEAGEHQSGHTGIDDGFTRFY